MNVSFHVEFDSVFDPRGVNQAASGLQKQMPKLELSLLDRQCRFATLRALCKNQRMMNRDDVPLVVKVIAAFIHFIVIPIIILIAWVFSIPSLLFSKKSTGMNAEQHDDRRYILSGGQPCHLSEVLSLLGKIKSDLGGVRILLATCDPHSYKEDEDDDQEDSCVRSSLEKIQEEGSDSMVELIGKRVELSDT